MLTTELIRYADTLEWIADRIQRRWSGDADTLRVIAHGFRVTAEQDAKDKPDDEDSVE